MESGAPQQFLTTFPVSQNLHGMDEGGEVGDNHTVPLEVHCYDPKLSLMNIQFSTGHLMNSQLSYLCTTEIPHQRMCISFGMGLIVANIDSFGMCVRS